MTIPANGTSVQRHSPRIWRWLLSFALLIALTVIYAKRRIRTAVERHPMRTIALPQIVATHSFLIAKNATPGANGWFRIGLADQKWSRITDEPFYTDQEYSVVWNERSALLYRLTANGIETIDVVAGKRNVNPKRSGCDKVVYLGAHDRFFRFESNGHDWAVSRYDSKTPEVIPGSANLLSVNALPWLVIAHNQVVFDAVDGAGRSRFILYNTTSGAQSDVLRINEPNTTATDDPAGPKIYTLTVDGRVTEYVWKTGIFVRANTLKLPDIGVGDVFQWLLSPPRNGWLPYQVFCIDRATGQPVEHIYAYKIDSGEVCDPITVPRQYINSEYVGWFSPGLE